jgi:hypothetical protein
MKNLSLLFMLGLTLFIISGCSTTPEKQEAKAEKEAQKKAFFEEGKMDDQVQSWRKPGGRY